MEIRRGVVRGYDRADHTATVELAGARGIYLRVPVSHGLEWWLMASGVQCGVVFFDETDQQDACLAFIYGGRPARDPRLDPSLGHRHRGLEDDAPTLT